MGKNKEELNTKYFSTRKELVYRVVCNDVDGWYIKISVVYFFGLCIVNTASGTAATFVV